MDESTVNSILYETNCTKEVKNFEPSFNEFLEILGLSGWLLFSLGSAAMILLIILFIDTFVYVIKHHPSKHKSSTSIVLTVYPILGLCSYLGIMFQKANSILDATAAMWFGLCMWQFFRMTISYFGGETQFVLKNRGSILPWKGPPCCCWPCCWPLCPKNPVNKKQIQVIKILILQHPFVQAIVSIIGVTFWIEGWYKNMNLQPTNSYIYLYIIATTSFSFALWAFIVGFKASLPLLKDFYYTQKIIAFQLSLVFLRLQGLIFNMILLPSGAFPCLPPISPTVYANTVLCSLMLGQMVILSVVARNFYKMKIPEVKMLSEEEISLRQDDKEYLEENYVNTYNEDLNP